MNKHSDTAIGVLMLVFEDFCKQHGEMIIDIYCQINKLSDDDWKELMKENDAVSNVLSLAADVAFSYEEGLI